MPFVCLLSSSQSRWSLVSVVFNFSASLNDAAPVSPISFPVDEMRKSDLLVNVFCIFFCIHISG